MLRMGGPQPQARQPEKVIDWIGAIDLSNGCRRLLFLAAAT